MPQTFQVLRCYKCEVFQVHPTKKANKWNCKLCGEKQSIKRFYGLGTGKECRLHVQKLNQIRGEVDSQCNTDTEDLNTVSDGSDPSDQGDRPNPITKKSKWTNYLDPHTQDQQQTPDESEETMHLNNIEVVLELPRKLARKRKNLIDKTNEIQNKTTPERYSVPTKILNNQTTNHTVNAVEKNKISLGANKPTTKIFHSKFVPPTVVTNSKWAHFVEPKEEKQSFIDENDIDSNTQVQNSTGTVFTFLQDEDLDDVLEL